MKTAPHNRSDGRPSRSGVITIRLATRADAAGLLRLAERDSAPPLRSSSIALAEVDGEMRAALALDRGVAIADPFHPTADLVAMLRALPRVEWGLRV